MHKKRVCPGFAQAPASPQKVCDENERNKHAHNNIIDGRKKLIGHVWETSLIDCKVPQVNDC